MIVARAHGPWEFKRLEDLGGWGRDVLIGSRNIEHHQSSLVEWGLENDVAA